MNVDNVGVGHDDDDGSTHTVPYTSRRKEHKQFDHSTELCI